MHLFLLEDYNMQSSGGRKHAIMYSTTNITKSSFPCFVLSLIIYPSCNCRTETQLEIHLQLASKLVKANLHGHSQR